MVLTSIQMACPNAATFYGCVYLPICLQCSNNMVQSDFVEKSHSLCEATMVASLGYLHVAHACAHTHIHSTALVGMVLQKILLTKFNCHKQCTKYTKYIWRGLLSVSVYKKIIAFFSVIFTKAGIFPT